MRSAGDAIAVAVNHDMRIRDAEDRSRKAERDRLAWELERKTEELDRELQFDENCTEYAKRLVEQMQKKQNVTTSRLSYFEDRQDELVKQRNAEAQAELDARNRRRYGSSGASTRTDDASETDSLMFQIVSFGMSIAHTFTRGIRDS